MKPKFSHMPWFFIEPFLWALLGVGLILLSATVEMTKSAETLFAALGGAIIARIRTRNNHDQRKN